MSWLRRILHSGRGENPLGPKNQALLKDFRQSSRECIDILRACRTQDQVIQCLSRIAKAGIDVSPVADNAARQLENTPGLNALRVRDDFIRQMEAFLSSARNL